MENKKIAIVHDWLIDYAGAERVLQSMIECYPQADLFALVDFMAEKDRGFLRGKPVTTSFIQRLPFAKSAFRHYLLLMPIAIEQFDLSHYDIVLSSSHAFAKSVITGPEQTHIAYIHTPMRYIWGMQADYRSQSKLKNSLIAYLFHKLRLWDQGTAPRVDHYLANSHYIKKRIQKVYARTAEVIYPPVDIANIPLQTEKQNYYVAASRLVEYKKIHPIIEAFQALPQQQLKIIGSGKEYSRLQKMIAGHPNIELQPYQSHATTLAHIQAAKAYLYMAREDFGITLVEAQACGTPVIAFAGGGALETIIDGQTGYFFDQQTPQALTQAIQRFEQASALDPHQIRQNALRFDRQNFQHNLTQTIKRYTEN
jgi:glycosyltransferase involved in cell wall biosynthesis